MPLESPEHASFDAVKSLSEAPGGGDSSEHDGGDSELDEGDSGFAETDLLVQQAT